MLINADLGERAVSFADEVEWTASSLDGVQRRILERDGDKIARATSVIRYPSGSHFPRHVHALGQELLVLDGMFSDEQGDYPAGTYVRNPPGSAHASWSDKGCVVLVKLRQFHPEDLERVVVDCRSAEWFPATVKGIGVLPLHRFGSEFVSLVRYARGVQFVPHVHPGGEEIYVLEGAVEDDEGRYAASSWIRNPPLSQHAPFSLDGCLLYVKIGHLPMVVK